MTYKKLHDKANRLLDNNKITLGEYEEMIKPLNQNVPETQDDAKTGKLKPCPYCNKEVFLLKVTSYRADGTEICDSYRVYHSDDRRCVLSGFESVPFFCKDNLIRAWNSGSWNKGM